MQEHYIRSLRATTITCPVIQRASSLARKVGARAMLSGCAIPPRVWFLLLLSCEIGVCCGHELARHRTLKAVSF